MWVLFSQKNPEQCVSLMAGLEYRVGRATGHVICHKDASVSRSHALIRVVAAAAAAVPDQSQNRPRVEIQDQGSKYGTYVGEAAIRSTESSTSGSLSSSLASQTTATTRKPVVVNPDEDRVRIKFGFQTSIFILKWTELVCTPSSLNKIQKSELSQILQTLPNAKMVNQWSSEVTHLVMTEVILTLKVVQALAKGIPIVTPLFFKDFKQCSLSQQILPDPANYMPKLVEKTLNPASISCKVNPIRRTLFQGCQFVFCTRVQMERYQSAIHDAGGQAFCASPQKKLDLQSDSILVIKPMNDSDMNGNPAFKAITETLRDAGRYSFPEQNIGIALLRARLDLDLDPKKKPQLRLSQKFIDATQDQNKWASQTQSLGLSTQSMLTSTGETSKVPETLTGAKSEVKSEEAREDEDDDLFGPSTSFKRPSSPKATPTSKRIKIEQPSDAIPRSSSVQNEDEDLFGCSPLPSMEPEAMNVPLSDGLVSKKRLRTSPKLSSQSPLKRSRLLVSPETTVPIHHKTAEEKDKTDSSTPKNLPGSSNQDIITEVTPQETDQVIEPSTSSSNSSVATSKANVTNLTESGLFFKKKSMSQIRGSQTRRQNESSVNEISVNDISLGCSLITLKSLFRPKIPTPTFVPSTKSQDLGRPVKNFKRFKKQGLASQTRRQFVSLNNTIDQTRQPSNHGDSLGGNLENTSPQNQRGQSEEDEDQDKMSDEDEVQQIQEGQVQSQEGEMWDF